MKPLDDEPRCWDAFSFTERNKRMLWEHTRQAPGWYPPLTQIFPMSVCRALPVAGAIRPAAYCRVLGRPGGNGRKEQYLGGYDAVLLLDPTGWPLFRFERLSVVRETGLAPRAILERLLADGRKFAAGLGASADQVTVLLTEKDRLPGFPATLATFGALPDRWLAEQLPGLGYSVTRRDGYFRAPAGPLLDNDFCAAAEPPGRPAANGLVDRPLCWLGDDLRRYHQLWSDYCAQHFPAYAFLAARQIPLDPFLQRHLGPADPLTRIRLLERGGEPVGLLSWYPDAYPQILRGEASGPQVRLGLAELDDSAVTGARVLKWAARGADRAETGELLHGALVRAIAGATARHPGLEWVEVGPVPESDEAARSVLSAAGFEPFGEQLTFEHCRESRRRV